MSSQESDQGERPQKLKYPLYMKFFALAVFIGCGWGVWKSFHADERAWLAVGMLGLFCVIGLFLVIECFTAKAQFDQTGLNVFSLWQGKKQASWDDLEEVSIGGITQFYKFQFRGRHNLYVYYYMEDSDDLVSFSESVIDSKNAEIFEET